MPREMLDQILTSAGLDPAAIPVTFAGADPVFPLALRVGEAGAAAIAATGVGAATLWRLRTGRTQRVHMDVDAGAAAMRGNQYLRRESPDGGEAISEGVALPGAAGGMYRTRDDRWIYLHRNFEHHRQRINDLLGCTDDAESI